MRRVSLFTEAGTFLAYVHVHGSPRVILYEGRTYVAFDAFGLTHSFRECKHEEGVR